MLSVAKSSAYCLNKEMVFFLNLNVNVQGAFDDGIQLNINNRKDRLELVEVVAKLGKNTPLSLLHA